MRLMSLYACLLAVSACAMPAQQPDQPSANFPKATREPDVMYEPTEPEVVDAMLRLANVTAGDVLYDLGSGDGRIPIRAASRFGVRAVGIELQPHLVATAQANALREGVVDRVSFRTADLFEVDLREATVVTLFLFADVNLRLRPKLLAELRPGARVISHWHSMGDWKPDKQIRVRAGPSQRARWLYLWIIPERKARRTDGGGQSSNINPQIDSANTLGPNTSLPRYGSTAASPSSKVIRSYVGGSIG